MGNTDINSLQGEVRNNFKRFISKIPANSKTNATWRVLDDGNYLFQTISPGKVPGSTALYEKIVSPQGETLRMIKTTFSPQGDKIKIMMTGRKQLLLDLILLRGKTQDIKKELSKYSWDSVSPIVKIDTQSMIFVLTKYIKGDISTDELEEWANLVECRDDIEIPSLIQEFIFELANPEINGNITKKKVNDYVKVLECENI